MKFLFIFLSFVILPAYSKFCELGIKEQGIYRQTNFTEINHTALFGKFGDRFNVIKGCKHVNIDFDASKKIVEVSDKQKYFEISDVEYLELNYLVFNDIENFILKNISVLAMNLLLLSDTRIHSMIIKNSYIPRLSVKNTIYKTINYLELDNVTIDYIEENGFLIKTVSFYMNNCRIGDVDAKAFRLKTSKAFIENSEFNANVSLIKILSSKEVHIINCTFIQEEKLEFFDVFSPFINVTQNKFYWNIKGRMKRAIRGELITMNNLLSDISYIKQYRN